MILYINIASIILTVWIAVIELYTEPNELPRKKKLLAALFVSLFFAQVASAVLQDKKGDKDAQDLSNALSKRDSINALKVENAQKKYDDSLKKYSYNITNLLSQYGLSIDTLTNSVKKIEGKQVSPPSIVIYSQDIKLDSNKVAFVIRNHGGGTAMKLRTNIGFAVLFAGKIQSVRLGSNEHSSLDPNDWLSASTGIQYNLDISNLTKFLVISIHYQSREGKKYNYYEIFKSYDPSNDWIITTNNNEGVQVRENLRSIGLDK